VAGHGWAFDVGSSYGDPTPLTDMVYDSPSADHLDNPDNITVTPRGGLLLCEDAAGNNFLEGERLIVGLGLQQRGQSRGLSQSEWAGACYSPDGDWLFVNIQTPGVAFAITGPWKKGPL
jgi:secreted PhoX family phosphatase